jgi:radical SAM enzyme (TIGR01210 family)
MYAAVESALGRLAPTTEMIWISAFNTLFEREVPAPTRKKIFTALARTQVKVVVTETHPASVRKEIIRECVEILDGRTFGVELGVETADEFARYACLNKPFSNKILKRAIDNVHAGGGVVYSNLLVGLPFLSEEEVIFDIARSVEDAVAMGALNVVLFPNHVKDHTVASLLAQAGRYDPPDLWTLQAIVQKVPQRLWPQVHFGWLDLKEHPGAARVTHEPDRANAESLHALLVEFNEKRDISALGKAVNITPDRAVGVPAEMALPDRILEGYRWLALKKLPGWWEEFGAVAEEEIRSSFSDSVLSKMDEG